MCRRRWPSRGERHHESFYLCRLRQIPLAALLLDHAESHFVTTAHDPGRVPVDLKSIVIVITMIFGVGVTWATLGARVSATTEQLHDESQALAQTQSQVQQQATDIAVIKEKVGNIDTGLATMNAKQESFQQVTQSQFVQQQQQYQQLQQNITQILVELKKDSASH